MEDNLSCSQGEGLLSWRTGCRITSNTKKTIQTVNLRHESSDTSVVFVPGNEERRSRGAQEDDNITPLTGHLAQENQPILHLGSPD
jgi:hypothetical protein